MIPKQRRGDIEQEVRRRNLHAFKLLITSDKFQEEILRLRKMLSRVREEINLGDKKPDEKNEHYEEYMDKLEKFSSFAQDRILKIIGKFKLPYHYQRVLSEYIHEDRINLDAVPDSNYTFLFDPVPRLSENRRPQNRIWKVNLVTFTKLTTEELRLAMEDLNRKQQNFFPDTRLFNGHFRARQDLDLQLEIEALCRNRRPTPAIKRGSYYEILRARWKKGEISDSEYKRAMKIGKEIGNIGRNQDLAYTSEFIAKLKKTTPNVVRQTIRRLSIERKSLFGV